MSQCKMIAVQKWTSIEICYDDSLSTIKHITDYTRNEVRAILLHNSISHLWPLTRLVAEHSEPSDPIDIAKYIFSIIALIDLNLIRLGDLFTTTTYRKPHIYTRSLSVTWCAGGGEDSSVERLIPVQHLDL